MVPVTKCYYNISVTYPIILVSPSHNIIFAPTLRHSSLKQNSNTTIHLSPVLNILSLSFSVLRPLVLSAISHILTL